jgi:hypothetical protein
MRDEISTCLSGVIQKLNSKPKGLPKLHPSSLVFILGFSAPLVILPGALIIIERRHEQR